MALEASIGLFLVTFDRVDEEVVSQAYSDGGTDTLFPRLERAALNQISGGEAMISRYAIWASTVRDNIRHAIELLEGGHQQEAGRFWIRSVNSLSAFAEIQALFDHKSW